MYLPNFLLGGRESKAKTPRFFWRSRIRWPARIRLEQRPAGDNLEPNLLVCAIPRQL